MNYIEKLKSKTPNSLSSGKPYKVVAGEIEKEKERLTALLKKEGVKLVTMSYSGSGDSGDVDDLDYKPHAPKDSQLQQDVEKYLDNVINSFESGWENNDGGRGEITWKVGGKLKMEHVNYVIQEDYSSYVIE